MGAFTKEDLKRFQAESLDDKFQRTLAKVSEWYVRWNYEVYVSFSGGKDSTVLADICARWCKIIGKPLYLVFVNTGLEYPEIQKHVKFFAQWLRDKYGIEVVLDILRPEMRFDEVVKTYGYPIIGKSVAEAVELGRNNLAEGKYSARLRSFGVTVDEAVSMGLELPPAEMLERYEKSIDGSKFERKKYKDLLFVDFRISAKCCDVMKKAPSKEYAKRTGRKPIIATMAVESMLREKSWLQNGCNAFDSKDPSSRPMSFWTEQDVLQYIKEEQIPIASVYGDVVYESDPEQMRIEDYGIEGGGREKLTTMIGRGASSARLVATLKKSRPDSSETAEPTRASMSIAQAAVSTTKTAFGILTNKASVWVMFSTNSIKSTATDSSNIRGEIMKEALATLRACKASLTRQEYKTLYGQIITGDINAARKGLRKILKRKEATA